FPDTCHTTIYTLSLHDALPIFSEIKYSKLDQSYSFTIPPQWTQRETHPHYEFQLEGEKLKGWTTGPKGNKRQWTGVRAPSLEREDRKSTRLNSSHVSISYAVFC